MAAAGRPRRAGGSGQGDGSDAPVRYRRRPTGSPRPTDHADEEWRSGKQQRAAARRAPDGMAAGRRSSAACKGRKGLGRQLSTRRRERPKRHRQRGVVARRTVADTVAAACRQRRGGEDRQTASVETPTQERECRTEWWRRAPQAGECAANRVGAARRPFWSTVGGRRGRSRQKTTRVREWPPGGQRQNVRERQAGASGVARAVLHSRGHQGRRGSRSVAPTLKRE